jgi:hypothetical protein
MDMACKLEYTWWHWEADPLERSKKYFPTIEKALEYCEEHLLHHKDWRIIQNGVIIQTLMGAIIGRPVGPFQPLPQGMNLKEEIA